VTDTAARDPHLRRLLVVADSDSYVKWGAALASTLPADWTSRLVVVGSPVQPSARQLAHALDGTRFAPADVRMRELEGRGGVPGLDDELDHFDPHAVLLALRGPFVRVIAPRLLRRPNRPVLVSGLTLPGAVARIREPSGATISTPAWRDRSPVKGSSRSP
jgi:hypothetical protein